MDHGYDPAFGARPMRRLIQREIEDQLAVRLIEDVANNNQKNPGKVIVSLSKDTLKVALRREKDKLPAEPPLSLEIEPIKL